MTIQAIKAILNSPDLHQQTTTLSQYVDRLSTRIDWYGRRVVVIEGEQDSIPLNFLTNRIIRVACKKAEKRDQTFNYSLAIKILRRLSETYRISDDQVARSKLVIRILNAIQRIFSFENALRKHLVYLNQRAETPDCTYGVHAALEEFCSWTSFWRYGPITGFSDPHTHCGPLSHVTR